MRLGGYAEACGEGDVVPVRFSTDEIDSLDDAVVRLRARPRSALIRDAVQKYVTDTGGVKRSKCAPMSP